MRFDHVWLRYGHRQRWVLTDVDVELPSGEVATVLGDNGAGKTTLLSAAAGLIRPTRGAIVDRPARTGWVPERFPPGQPFTIAAYLAAMARIRGVRGRAASDGIAHWAERLGLTPYLGTRLAEVSKGTAQKVGLIQALVPRPDLLVLDEPWEGLDARTREQVPVIIAEILGAGGRVLVSDHIGEVARLPGARRWLVADHTVRADRGSDDARLVIEIVVTAAAAPSTVAELRAGGHDVLRVRPVAS